jgi:hypothetical protein
MSNTRAVELTRDLAQMGVSMLAALNSGGNSTVEVLRTSNVPMGLLDAAAQDGSAVRGGAPVLGPLGGAPGNVRPGSAGRGGIGLIGQTAVGDPTTAGSVDRPKGPTAISRVGDPTATGGRLANAGKVVAGLSGGFRICYQRGMRDDSTMQGGVRITAQIGPNGEVRSVSTSSTGGNLSPGVVSCVAGRVRGAQFSPPEGGGATLVIPVTFVAQ